MLSTREISCVEPTLQWHVDAAKRRELETTRLGRRVLCTDRHNWSTGRIVYAFRGQWNVEELFRRAKKGGEVPWGPSHQWADGSLRLHTFATVQGLMLVSLARIALAPDASARRMMDSLEGIQATLVRTTTGGPGLRLVLCQTLEVHLLVPEQVLHNVEWMLDLRTHSQRALPGHTQRPRLSVMAW
jgi:hypothetical protein